MPTTVFIRHKDGRRIPVRTALPRDHAVQVKEEIEKWVAKSRSLTVTSAKGGFIEITPRSVVAVVLIDEQEHLDPEGQKPE